MSLWEMSGARLRRDQRRRTGLELDALCPLKVVRRRYQDETDAYLTYVDVCGEPLRLHTLSAETVFADGERAYDTYPTWEVRCDLGHVVLLPDQEGDDIDLPYEPGFWREAMDPTQTPEAVVSQRAEPE